MFNKLEGETAILKSGGVYKVSDLYEMDGKLFASFSGGYVRLYASGSTSKDKVNVDTIAIDGPLYQDRLGRLCTSDGEGRKAVPYEQIETLMLTGD